MPLPCATDLLFLSAPAFLGAFAWAVFRSDHPGLRRKLLQMLAATGMGLVTSLFLSRVLSLDDYESRAFLAMSTALTADRLIAAQRTASWKRAADLAGTLLEVLKKGK